MTRILVGLFRWLVSAAILLAGTHLPAQSPAFSTAVCGTLVVNTTWNLAASPYEVCTAGVTVPTGVTLTIDPGVTVQFDALAGNKLNLQGVLVANGTAAQGITLTGLTASPGSWGGINAVGTSLDPALVTLNYVTLDYGGVAGSSGAQIYADHTVLSINHSLIQNSAGNGVLATLNSTLDTHDTSFVGNAQDAILLNQPSTDLLMTNLSASGNGANAVHVAGSSVFHGLKRWSAPGIPYLIDGPVRTDLGDTLTLDPGSELRFTSTGWLYIRGRLSALGTSDAPILMTAQTQLPGGWIGMFIDGGLHQAVAQLDYVTIEYGGSAISGANIEVANGKLIAAHSIIRGSAKDGVRFDSNWGGAVLESQIIDNGQHGVRNLTPQRAVLATNNWWGDAGGPQSDVAACSTGLGSQVSSGVIFLPVRAAPDAPPSLPLSSAPNLTVTPRRWFAPADNVSLIYFDITVRDGNGAPIPGRTVILSSSLGNPTSGGITDANGHTLAYLKSSNVGDAVVTASINVTGCEGALSPEATVTFTTPIAGTDLLPNAPSSYFDGDIQVNPMPVVLGVDTTISAKLTNPLSTPITVNVAFQYADAGIGLVFGPIDEIFGQVIPANSSVNVSATFTPPVTGHFCVQVTYTITAVGLVPVRGPLAGSSGTRQKNLLSQPGSMGSPSSKETLARADKAFKGVSKLPSGPTQIQKAIVGSWWTWMKSAVSDATKALGLDPPRQDYNQVTLPERHPIPHVVSGANVSPARAAAMNAVTDALTDVEAFGTAAATAMDRYGGASEANNLQWASEQANELLYYQEQLGLSLMTYADLVDAFVLVLQNEAETQINVSLSDISSYQLRLANTGFTAQEVADARLAGLSDAQIEALRLEIIATKPDDLAGNLLEKYTGEAVVSRALANSLLHPTTFQPSVHVSGSAGLLPDPPANTMAQLYNSVTTFQLANPLLVSALINLKERRIGLPADWTVDISPAQITLAPGEQTTVTVTVIAASPLPQGSQPRVAVEGFSAAQLLGGMVIDVVVPTYAPFDGNLHIFLPLLKK